MVIDYSILTLPCRKKHVALLLEKHPYFHVREAINAETSWGTVENVFISHHIQVTKKFDTRVGKFGRWASFISWLSWLSENSIAYNYGVLMEDDVELVSHFRESLLQFIEKNPSRCFFRCGPYNSCLVVRSDMASHILDKIRETGVDMPDDWWSWKSGRLLQQGIPKLVMPQLRIPSTINFSSRIQNFQSKMWNLM